METACTTFQTMGVTTATATWYLNLHYVATWRFHCVSLPLSGQQDRPHCQQTSKLTSYCSDCLLPSFVPHAVPAFGAAHFPAQENTRLCYCWLTQSILDTLCVRQWTVMHLRKSEIYKYRQEVATCMADNTDATIRSINHIQNTCTGWFCNYKLIFTRNYISFLQHSQIY